MKYRSTKTYGHDLGLSACFRQWRADSHCRFLHGYALSFRFEFGANQLDERNWVIDFGALKPLKERLVTFFDHKLIVANDDPMRGHLLDLNNLLLADAHVFDNVGCEAFARYAFLQAQEVVRDIGQRERVKVISCECAEHGANSGIYYNPEFA
jgi:6-pyruvoyltetrahydropterin/6-carboxytetrahydropterin synthase